MIKKETWEKFRLSREKREDNFIKDVRNLFRLKKITHMWRRWGTPQNFFLAFIDELEKQIIIKKTVEVGQQKQNNFNIYNVVFF